MSHIYYLFCLLLLLNACNSDSNLDVQPNDNVLVEKPKRLPTPKRDTIIIGTEESQVDSVLGDVEVTPEFTYNHAPLDKIYWTNVENGLDYAEIEAPIKCNVSDSKITVIRINPKKYELKLLNAKETGDGAKTLQKWAERYDLVAAINAGMYRNDYATSTGYMQNFNFINNPELHEDYKSITVFNPIDPAQPPFQIIDLDCQNWDVIKGQYNCHIQCLRMVDCYKENKWSKQDKYWSIAAIIQYKVGNVFLLFSITPYSVYDFNNMIIELPLKATKVMYLEGGPEASIYLHYKSHLVRKMGSYESGYKENDLNRDYLAIPNVIGVKKREQ
jgi:hypothetical protein